MCALYASRYVLICGEREREKRVGYSIYWENVFVILEVDMGQRPRISNDMQYITSFDKRNVLNSCNRLLSVGLLNCEAQKLRERMREKIKPIEIGVLYDAHCIYTRCQLLSIFFFYLSLPCIADIELSKRVARVY